MKGLPALISLVAENPFCLAEDTLNHHSYEVSEKWLRENVWFWDKEVLEITNAWRARRGEPILTREDLVGKNDP